MTRKTLRQIFLSSLVFCALTVPVYAGTVIGTPVTIEGLQNLSATVQQQSKGGLGKAFAILLGLGGLATLAAGRPGLGLGGLGAGVAMAFVPNIIGTAFDATAAGPLLAVALPQATAVIPLQGMAYAAMYPLLLAWRFLQDPVVLLCVGSAWAARLGKRGTHGA